MKLSASVMAHPARAGEVELLLSALDREVPVYWDPDGPPSGAGDRVWRVAREAWQMFDPTADFHALIQDDAVPSSDLLTGLELALDHVPPDVVVSPYLGQGRNVSRRWTMMADKADAVHASWVRSPRVMWGVCLILPTRAIPDMIGWANRKAGMPDDMRVNAWAVRHQVECWYTWPSLIDHRPVPSLTKHRASDRTARRWHADTALGLDWSGPVVTDPLLRRRSAPRGEWRQKVTNA